MSTREQVDALGGIGRGGGTRRLAEIWAGELDVSVSSQLRRIQRALRSGREPARLPADVRSASVRHIIADKLRRARTLGPASVRVTYGRNGRREGSRTWMDSFSVNSSAAEAFENAANALEDEDLETFRDAFSEGILDSYDETGGDLGESLAIEGYDSDLDLD